MNFQKTALEGAYLIDPDYFPDARGSFTRLWAIEELTQRGLDPMISQMGSAFNDRRGTLRGMHYQKHPFEEVKYIRVVSGAVFDVIVDLRPQSQTFRRWFGVELSASNRKILYVPKGMAHGYITLADATEITYSMSAPYTPSAYSGFRWNDPKIGIEWPMKPTVIADRDDAFPDLT